MAAGCAAIAAWVEERKPQTALLARFEEVRALCEQAAARERSALLKGWLANMSEALRTWQNVWPRLGTQQEFRLAVAREARLWGKRLFERR